MEKLTPQIDGAYPNAQVTYDPHPIVGDAYANCRLILTPLSAISDEDEIQVGRIARPEIKDVHHLRNIGTNIIADIINGRNLLEIGFAAIQHIIDYLRSRNYDLGYMHIRSLIDAGIAISSTDKTETK